MGKQGPCCHCGISITPLWRNGPADKPVLCNACGSRWRTKGTLANYMPMHLGGLGLKSGSTKKSTQNLSDHHSRKRKKLSDDDFVYPRSNHTTGIMLEEETSTRSSTDSRISFSESCTQRVLAASRASDCWPPWGSHAPSKRRTVMHRRPHPANILPCSLLSSSPFECKISLEDDLLVEYRTSSMTAEIGLGGMLIQPIVSTNTAQESQASSHLFDNKEFDQSVALRSDVIREESLDVHVWDQSTKPRAKEKTKLSARSIGAIDQSSAKTWVPNKTLLENFPYNKHDVLQSCHSPLVFVELKDIINFDLYESLLSKQEQQQLVGHVSPADTVADSLRCMFSSAQFESALRGFQALLSEGMFDSLASGISLGVLQHYQQLLTLSNLTTSGWMESCSQLLRRGRRNGSTKYVKIMQGKEYLTERLRGTNALAADVVSSSIDLMATKNPTGSVTTESALKKDYPQPEPPASRQKHSAKCNSIEKKRGNRSKFNAKNVHLSSKGKRSSTNQGILIEAPFYGVLEHEILLDLPSSLSFQQAELLQKPARSKSPPQEADIVVDQSKRNDDTLSQSMLPCEGDLDWSSYLCSIESVNESV